jgi:hypothetical protein
MVKGLNEYNTRDRVFNSSILYQGLFSIAGTALWHNIAGKYGLVSNRHILVKTLPFVFVINMFLTRGLANHFLALKTHHKDTTHAKYDNLVDYKNELRNKNIIQ